VGYKSKIADSCSSASRIEILNCSRAHYVSPLGFGETQFEHRRGLFGREVARRFKNGLDSVLDLQLFGRLYQFGVC
jgi:hypothetical protein